MSSTIKKLGLIFWWAVALSCPAGVTATRNGVNLPTRTYPSAATQIVPVAVTLAAEAGFVITATLDGQPLPMGTTVVAATGYHEVYETRVNTATNASSTSLAYQFIIAGPGRGTSEMGLPVSEPWSLVNDAPSALAGQQMEVMAPSQYPLNLPVPVAVRLKKGFLPEAPRGIRCSTMAGSVLRPIRTVASKCGGAGDPPFFLRAAPRAQQTLPEPCTASRIRLPSNTRLRLFGPAKAATLPPAKPCRSRAGSFCPER